MSNSADQAGKSNAASFLNNIVALLTTIDQDKVLLWVMENVSVLQGALHAVEHERDLQGLGLATPGNLAKQILVCLRGCTEAYGRQRIPRWIIDSFDSAHRNLSRALANDEGWRAELHCEPLSLIDQHLLADEPAVGEFLAALHDLKERSPSVAASDDSVSIFGMEAATMSPIPVTMSDSAYRANGDLGLLDALRDPFQHSTLDRLHEEMGMGQDEGVSR